MKGKRFLGFLLALSGCFPIVQATTDDVSTDSPVVSVPVFIENFDDCIGGNGGNDNVWSGLDRLAFGDDNLYTGKEYITGSHVYRMNQCVAVGSPSVLGILTKLATNPTASYHPQGSCKIKKKCLIISSRGI